MLPVITPSRYLPASREVDYIEIPMKTLPSPRLLLRPWVSYVHEIIEPCEKLSSFWIMMACVFSLWSVPTLVCLCPLLGFGTWEHLEGSDQVHDVGRTLDRVYGICLWSLLAFQHINRHLLTGRGMVSRDTPMPLRSGHPACKTQRRSVRDGWVRAASWIWKVRWTRSGMLCTFSLFKYMRWWVTHLVRHTWLK